MIYSKLLLSDVVDTVRLHPGPCFRKDLFPFVGVLSPESFEVSAPQGLPQLQRAALPTVMLSLEEPGSG